MNNIFKNLIKKKTVSYFLVLFFLFSFLFASDLLAQSPVGFDYASQLGLGTRDLRATVIQFVKIGLGMLGTVAVLIVMYGGYLYMTSGGDENKIILAKKVLINASVGLVITLSSYAIVAFVFGTATSSLDGGGGGGGGGPVPPGGSGGNFAVSWEQPKNSATNVSLCNYIQVGFNQTLNPTTIATAWTNPFTVDDTTLATDANFQVIIDGAGAKGSACAVNKDCQSGVCESLFCKGDLVPGEITAWGTGMKYDNTNDFEQNTTYRATVISQGAPVNKGLKSTLGGYLNTGNYSWTFTTGTTTDIDPPKVDTSKLFPPINDPNVSLSCGIQAGFSEPMDVMSLLATNLVSPMDAGNTNSIYINPAMTGFDKSTTGSKILNAQPAENFTASTVYTSTLDSDVIKDACGNFLDGDGDGTAEKSPADDYAWSFTVGSTVDCAPVISAIAPANGYYDNIITITGNNFKVAGIVNFKNGLEVISDGTDTNCFDGTYIPNQDCLVSWAQSEIKVKVPAGGGVSNGAITGDVYVNVGPKNDSNKMNFIVDSPHILNIYPATGGTDQFVSLIGNGFGLTPDPTDKVYFKKVSDPTITVLANLPCGGTAGWQDNQIIISVPDNPLFVDGEQWYLQIVLNEGTTNYWSSVKIFTFENVEPGPGLCSVVPNSGKLDDPVVLTGVRLADTVFPIVNDVRFGSYADYVGGKNTTGWSVTSVNSVVPNILAGQVGVFVNSDGKNSNSLNFTVSPTTKGPKIDYFSPLNAVVGTYVTIYGTGFGNSKTGSANVKFGTINGDFVFPVACGDGFWTDTQIIVKVPTGAPTGLIQVIDKDGLFDDTTDLSPASITIGTGTPDPGICNITPKSGPLGTGVDIFGEGFTGTSAVTFFNNKNATYNNLGVTNFKVPSAIVPGASSLVDTSDDATTGDVTVTAGTESNGYNFKVFDCRSASDGCAYAGSGLDCCYDGTCASSGGCLNPTDALYEWDFSSGAYNTCGGYSFDQCTTAISCPNSPGQCNPSPATTVFTSNACGNDYCNSLAECKYSPDCVDNNNKCQLNGSVCNISSSTVIAGKNVSCVENSWSTIPRVGYWHFDEGKQSTAKDSSGNEKDGLVYGNAVWESVGRYGSAINFDGVDDYVDVGNVGNVKAIELWIKNNASSVILELNNTDNITIAGSAVNTTGIPVGANLYVNGVPSSTLLAGWNHLMITSSAGTNASAVNIGRVGAGYMNGIIDEVIFYDRVLTIDEVKARYLSGTKDYLWQYPVGAGCEAGSFEDSNGKCTLGEKIAPTLCSGCQTGFKCDATTSTDGVCVINKNLCDGSSVCSGADDPVDADSYFNCQIDKPGSCDCCCRVGYSEEDCCAGLTCEDDNCGTDDAVFTYGFCKGCAVWDTGNFYQGLSDDKCGCSSGSRVCLVDELNTPPEDKGSCADCKDINSFRVAYDSNNDGDVVAGDQVDVQHECESHGQCCWGGGADSCYTCNTLRVKESDCIETPAIIIPSSPSPKKEEQEACLNSNIQAIFNMDLELATLQFGATVKQCNTGGAFNAGSCSTVISGTYTTIAKGFNFAPSILLIGNTWYQVTLDSDIKSVAPANLRLKDEYIWQFKTALSTQPCKPDSITVSPQDIVLSASGDSQIYNSFPTKGCNILDPTSYTWAWDSSDENIATIIGSVTNTDTATALAQDGRTTISASTEGLKGTSELTVLLENPRVIKKWPECDQACMNASVGADFNMAMDILTLNSSNVKLAKWICGNGQIDQGEDCDDGNSESGDGCNSKCLNEGGVGIGLNKKQYWPFNEGSGTTTKNVINNNLSGSLVSGPIWKTGADCKSGSCLEFDGVDDYVDVPFDSELVYTGGDMSLSVWINIPTADLSDRGGIISKPWNGSGEYNYLLAHGSSNELSVVVMGTKANGDAYTFSFSTDPNIITPDVWHLVNVVMDNSRNVIIYLDGIKIASTVNNIYSFIPASGNGSIDLIMGNIYPNSVVADHTFKGLIDDVRIYKKALNEKEINDIYQAKDSTCGNEKIDKGEECDSVPFAQGCDPFLCLKTGSVSSLSICGDGVVGQGENCDGGAGCDSTTCLNQGTNELNYISAGVTPVGADSVSLIPATYFDPNTYYKAILTTGVTSVPGKSLTGLNYDTDKDGKDDSYSWSFKTKDTYCGPDTVKLDPASALLRSINAQKGFDAYPYGAPDACNPDGQQLNPYNYNWDWSSSLAGVASLPNTLNNWPVCGNSRIEAGEDCDDGLLVVGDGCGATCLNEGTTTPLCQNGIVDIGEDCDGNPFPQGCSVTTCLHTGSVVEISVCGDGLIEEGEDCDDKNNFNGDGCSAICLNEGTITDLYNDSYQEATSKSPGKTDISASVNYCSNNQIKTCGGTLLACSASDGACVQATGSSELEVACGYATDSACSQGACEAGFCTNNNTVPCTIATEATDCNLSSACNANPSPHNCPVSVWGGICTGPTPSVCFADTDCPTAQTCAPKTDCNNCANNTSIECRTNTDCQLGVGTDSCCYSRPTLESFLPDPTVYGPDVVNCGVAGTCDNLTVAKCQTYKCLDTDATAGGDTCSAYGKCPIDYVDTCTTDADCAGAVPGSCVSLTCNIDCVADADCTAIDANSFCSPSKNCVSKNISCLEDNDCPVNSVDSSVNVCDKSCANDSECNDVVCGSCRNAQISLTFDQLMDAESFTKDGVCSNNSSKVCQGDSECAGGICLANIRVGVRYDDATINQKNCPSGYYVDQSKNLVENKPKNFIARIFDKVKRLYNNLFGKTTALATPYWCAIQGTISSYDSNNKTTAIFKPIGLKDNLFMAGLDYQVTVTDKVKNIQGVKFDPYNTMIGSAATPPSYYSVYVAPPAINARNDWRYVFKAGDVPCEVDVVDIYISGN